MAIDISHRRNGPARKITFHQTKKRQTGFSSDILKLIAIAAMLIDHIAWAFVPLMSVAGQAMHVVGRITAPIMCFMVSEGYAHTRDPKKYALRLGIFAVISHIPYVYFETGSLNPLYSTSVIFTLLLGLAALMIQDSPKLEPWTKTGLFLAICIISMIGDWNAAAVIWIYYFYQFRYSRKEQIKGFCVISAVIIAMLIIADIIYSGGLSVYSVLRNLFQLGIFLAVPLIARYNGERKKGSLGKVSKWFFYIFYPAHLVVLGILRYNVFK